MLGLSKLPTSCIEYTLPEDPAVDRESPACDVDMYHKTLEQQYLPIKPNEKATVFVMDRLSLEAMTDIDKLKETDVPAAAIRTVSIALRDIKNGPPIELSRKHERLTPACLKELKDFFSYGIFDRLAAVVWRHSIGNPF